MKKAIAVGALCLAALAGCQDTMGGPYTQQPVSYNQTAEYGRIVGVRQVTVGNDASGTQTGNMLLGAAAGAVIGNQFGKGSGNVAMTGLGAIGGALAAQNLANSQPTTRVVPQWRVRLDNGGTLEVIVPSNQLRVGQRVRVIQNGNNVQLVPVSG
ncbi:MAG: glycine zipper 2TM domain-containing protein [Paracoccaceae bacterium]|nr:glycine zipper 2TM domain-containing protein [Paracoccaceae bacterium]